jgi:hypothetical protein
MLVVDKDQQKSYKNLYLGNPNGSLRLAGFFVLKFL